MNKDVIQQVAAKAVISDERGRVLILRESSPNDYATNTQSGKWQLPGGRVEKGEEFEQALTREVFEETKLDIEIGSPILVGEWRPVIHGRTHQIIGVFVACRAKTTEVVVSPEHDSYAWITKEEFRKYAVIPPDNQAIDKFFG